MILLAFAHPVTPEQEAQLRALTGRAAVRVVYAPAQLDQSQPFGPQLSALVGGIGLSPEEWQGEEIVVIPPSLSSVAAMLLAHLHGRMGYFPPVARLRPVTGAVPTRFEVAEILDLNDERDAARRMRG